MNRPTSVHEPKSVNERAGMTGPNNPSGSGDEHPRGWELLRAVEVMEALAAPDGDAWTHTQTHSTLARYLLEETHEVLDVIDDPAGHGPQALADELGDLLFQILFHAQLGTRENPAWDIDDVARAIIAKMERRNPHVFADDADRALRDRDDVDEIIAQWHAVKAAERASEQDEARTVGLPGSDWFAHIPAQLPALQTALKAVHRARSDGRLQQLRDAAHRAANEDDAEDWAADQALGLLELVIAAESRDRDPETALRTLLCRTERILAQGNSLAGSDRAHSE